MLAKEEAAERLDGCEYGAEGSPALFSEMEASGLVAVFGGSDDLIEFRGAVHDEVGAYRGGIAHFTPDGLVQDDRDDDEHPRHARRREGTVAVRAIWDDGGYSWRYETPIPHATFDVLEDGTRYCRGIVFALTDVPSA